MSAKEPTGHDDHEHHEDTAPVAPVAATPVHGYWKSMRELSGTADWQLRGETRKEFAPGADQAPILDPMSRRNFFNLMGASMGLAGVGALAAGCRRYEKEEIVPLAKRPEDQIPGTTLQYATVYEMGGATHPLVATSFEGRPIHLDGNPEHPFAGGGVLAQTKRRAGAHTFAQASILHLYDPDRSTTALESNKGSSMDAFKIALGDVRKAIDAGGARILAEASSSPTLEGLRNKLAAKGVKWHEYEPISWDNERSGTKLAFKRPLRPIAKLDQCMTIVSIDCDLFVEHPASMKYSRDFAKSRKAVNNVPGTMSRLWVVESIFSNTGAVADHRLPLRSEFGLPFLLELDKQLGGGGVQTAEFLKETKVANFIAVLAEELKKNAGKSVVLAGRRQPPEVHALVAKINAAIGAVGNTLDYVEDPWPDRPSHLESITQLVKDINSGSVKTLIMLGGNPVYDAPVDLEFTNALAKVTTSIHLSEYADETSLHTTWHVPKAHFLEAWGDARTHDGTITLAQPLIAPLFGGLSSIELCSLLLGNELGGDQLVKDEHAARGVVGWRKNVHDGFVPNTALPQATGMTVETLPVPALKPSQTTGSKRGKNELEVVFHMSSFTYDGRYSNNAWLWETPDFLTKVTWDNYALISPETSTALDVANGDIITVKLGDHSVDIPAYTMPGQARYSIGLVLGGGRTQAGHVSQHPKNVDDKVPGKRVVGWDTYKVRTTGAFDYATGATVTKTGKNYELAEIQDHWSYNPGQSTMMKYDGGFDKEVTKRAVGGEHPLIREVTAAELAAKPNWSAEETGEFWDDNIDAAKPNAAPGRHLSLFQEHEYSGHRWGMSIDLSTCTGCNACMVACQSENNIPVVGRREVINNREMSWIRIDRYFTGSPDDPRVVHEPVACQQCENAPCEQVCPVGATQHSEEGLNDMAYNRCIGTRYCANNCPYKVRRFNFLDWNSEFREAREKVRQLLFNPDVTVRMRGVMEKCTYCVQRIQNGKIRVKAQIRAHQREGTVTGIIADGEIETACQMACPTEAIVFGDLSDKDSRDPNSRVSVAHDDRRQYALLPETYTKPRTRYLARVRNPNKDLVNAMSTAADATLDSHHDEPAPGKAREAFRKITSDVSWVAEAPKPHKLWILALVIAIGMFLIGIYSIYTVVMTGIGVWGNSNTVCWAWDITNFVWWIGIGHAGTLISAVLYLTRQQWRTSINRAAEAMTIFAVMAAGIFPLLHTGRPWFAWWMLPLPNDMGSMWPQFRSPLMWDVFAVSTYLTTSVLFWFMGMVPDLATFRDRNVAKGNTIRAIIYGIFSLGWRGSARQWHRYERAYLILAGLATPLVFSVHSVVSFDFATSQLPGWHTTIFPPYFVAGAIFSGFAMVLTLVIPLRFLFRLQHIITQDHIGAMCKIMLATGSMVGLAYGTEFFIAWYSGNPFEKFTFISRAFGPFWWAYFLMVGNNVLIPQFFWFKKVRQTNVLIWCLCICINIGMWFERFVIIATSLARSFLPSAWSYYSPTRYDIGVFVGTIGMFLMFFLLFFRFLPVVAMSEVKGAMPEAHAGKGHH